LGKTIELAGDALTPLQIAAALSRAAGRTITHAQIPLDVLRKKGAEAAQVFEWFNKEGYRYGVDIPTLRRLYPGLTDFDTWLEREGRSKLKALLGAEAAHKT
jgi:uncharacterized protein YbjT (DUF2867 family)